MFAVGGGERSATTSERLVAKCLPTTLQVLFGLILNGRLYGQVKLSALADSVSAYLLATLVHIQVVCCNHVPRVVLLHLLQHLFFTSGLEAARGAGLVAAGVATMGKYE